MSIWDGPQPEDTPDDAICIVCEEGISKHDHGRTYCGETTCCECLIDEMQVDIDQLSSLLSTEEKDEFARHII